MTDFKNILVATDTRLDVHPIVQEAALIAEKSGASIKLVDVVPDFPWIVRLSLKDHQEIRDLLINEKQKELLALALPLRQRGISVDTQVLSGKTSVETYLRDTLSQCQIANLRLLEYCSDNLIEFATQAVRARRFALSKNFFASM